MIPGAVLKIYRHTLTAHVGSYHRYCDEACCELSEGSLIIVVSEPFNPCSDDPEEIYKEVLVITANGVASVSARSLELVTREGNF